MKATNRVFLFFESDESFFDVWSNVEIVTTKLKATNLKATNIFRELDWTNFRPIFDKFDNHISKNVIVKLEHVMQYNPTPISN